MRPFTFNPGPRLLAGPDQATALAEKLPPGRCLLVTDRDLVRLGLTDAYREAIGKDRELDPALASDDRDRRRFRAGAGGRRHERQREALPLGDIDPPDLLELVARAEQVSGELGDIHRAAAAETDHGDYITGPAGLGRREQGLLRRIGLDRIEHDQLAVLADRLAIGVGEAQPD